MFVCSTVKEDVSVWIAGSVCDVESVTDTQIVCVTNEHEGTVKAKVKVKIANNGWALQVSTDIDICCRLA